MGLAESIFGGLIVGGGLLGSGMANWLNGNSNWKGLMIEAGAAQAQTKQGPAVRKGQ